jgi:predicted Fe-Mo cluster-binding NifX family protein
MDLDGGFTVKLLKTGSIVLGLFILGGFLILKGQEEQPKKIAIASDGETIDSKVGSQGARCPWFLFFDQQGQLTKALQNPHQQADRGAGVKCAELLADHGVTIFVAGNIGDKMAEALEEKNIDFISFSGTVKDAIKHVLE